MKPIIYQIFTRLYGNNKHTTNLPNGSIEQNGCAKINDITSAQLKRTASYGFTHVWFTGLIEHATQPDYSQYGIATDHPAVVKGRAGSPYAIKDYYDIDPDLATDVPNRMSEFESLLKRTHLAGLKMVIDFVPNHVARQYHSDASPKGVHDLGQDDDTSQSFSPQNNFYYIEGQTLHTECDMAEMVPAEFWRFAIQKVHDKYPHVLFIAEVYNPGEYRHYIASGFNYLYDKVGLYDTLRAIICDGRSASSITGCWQSIDDIRDHMLNFLENHDEQRIASAYFAGNAHKALPALVVSSMMGTNPFMVYAGQEIGETGMDAEGFSGSDGRTSIFAYWSVPSLRKLTSSNPANELTTDEATLYNYYYKVLNLCKKQPAITNGAFYDLQYANYSNKYGYNCDRQYAFIRKSNDGQTLLIVANFDPNTVHVGVCIPSHAISFLHLRCGLTSATDLITGNLQTIEVKEDSPAYIQVPGNGAIVLQIAGKAK